MTLREQCVVTVLWADLAGFAALFAEKSAAETPATGEVVRGEFGPDWQPTSTAFGEAINRAARLQRAARANGIAAGIVMDDDTRKQLEA